MLHSNRRPEARWTRIGIGLVAVASLALSACAGGSSSDEGEQDSGAVALSLGSADVPVWNEIIEYMRPIIDDAGYEFLTHDPQWDVAKQASDWDTWIARGDVKAMMGFPIQVEALGAVSQRIVDQEIPLLGYGENWEQTSAAFLTDGYEDGLNLATAAAEWITERYGTDADIEVVTFGVRDDDLSRSRAEGYHDGLTKALPNVTVREVAALTRQDGYDGAQASLTANPDIKVWIGAEGATLGAYQALMEKGVAVNDEDYFIGALDLTEESLELLEIEDSIYRVGWKFDNAEIADVLAGMLLAAAAGETPEDVYVAPYEVTAANVNEFID
jgi:ABC-type sugar transport system substrate-binding protein